MARYNYGSLTFGFCAGLVVLGIIIVVVLLASHIPDKYHYSGNSTLTADEYVNMQLRADEQLREQYSEADTYISDFQNGQVVYQYDFDSDYEYPELNKTSTSFGSRLRDSFVKNFSVSKIILPLILLTIGLTGGVYIIKNPVKVNRVFQRVNNWLEKLIDKSVKDKDSIQFARVADNPNDISTIDANGIICVRSWNYKGGDLASVVRGTKWENSELIANKIPQKDDVFGIYAYRIGTVSIHITMIMGIVELDGKYEYHPDGVIRSEHCKILAFFINRNQQRLGRSLSGKYNVPVYFDDSSIAAYNHWLYSESGQRSLQHNFELLREDNNGNGN